MGKRQKDYDVQTDGPFFVSYSLPEHRGALRDPKSYFEVWICSYLLLCLSPFNPSYVTLSLIPVSSSESPSQPCLILNLYVLQAHDQSPPNLLIPAPLITCGLRLGARIGSPPERGCGSIF